MTQPLFRADLIHDTASGILRGKLGHLFEVPPSLASYLCVDEDTGVPQPGTMNLSEVYLDVLEDLMGIMTAWAGTLSDVRDGLEQELKSVEAEAEYLENRAFLGAPGPVENRKKLAKTDPVVCKADFNRRVLEYAYRRVSTLTERLDRFVGVLKYVHRRTQERATRSGTIPGHT